MTQRTVHEQLAANREFTEQWLVEDDVLLAAREQGDALGAVPIGAGGGAVLRFLASVVGARAVVELGTGAGVSACWLLRGMHPDGVLTSIDVKAEHQKVARQTLLSAGFAPNRFRLINGDALDVMSRLTDGAYDLVFGDAAKDEYADYLHEARRLLRPGGIVVFDNTLWHGAVADPAVKDPQTLAVRDLLRQIREDERLVPVLLPVGDGLVAAVVR